MFGVASHDRCDVDSSLAHESCRGKLVLYKTCARHCRNMHNYHAAYRLQFLPLNSWWGELPKEPRTKTEALLKTRELAKKLLRCACSVIHFETTTLRTLVFVVRVCARRILLDQRFVSCTLVFGSKLHGFPTANNMCSDLSGHTRIEENSAV